MALLKGNESDDLTLKYLLQNSKNSKDEDEDGGGAKIHVGPDEPTDNKVNIWLDTDEQGTSVVTSVNGQTGAVTAVNSVNGQTGDVVVPTIPDSGNTGDVLAKASGTDYDVEWILPLSMKLLWTNPDPTSSFAAQTLQIDLSNYSAVEVIYRHFGDVGETGYGAMLCIKGLTSGILVISYSNNRNGVRMASPTDAGVTFSTCLYNNAVNNNYGVPLYIFGIKGIT